MNNILDVKGAAEYLHCSESTIRKLIRNKKIPNYRIAYRIYFKKSLLDLWVENQCKNNWNLIADNKEITEK